MICFKLAVFFLCALFAPLFGPLMVLATKCQEPKRKQTEKNATQKAADQRTKNGDSREIEFKAETPSRRSFTRGVDRPKMECLGKGSRPRCNIKVKGID